jgi:IPT/TIG domain-containing protein
MVTIAGSDFVSGATVSFGSAAASTSFNSSSQLTAVTPPASAAGPVSVRVQNPDGQSATLTGGFTYTQASGAPPPQFASTNPITPTRGSTDEETEVTINGSNFVSGAIVFFGAVRAGETKFISANQLRAETPESSRPGTVDVKVQNPDGQSALLPQSFTFTKGENDDEGEDDEMHVGFGIGGEDDHDHSGGGGSGEGGDDKAIPPGNLVGGGIFSFSQNNTLVTTVGTLASPPTSSFLMFVDTKRLNSLKGAVPNNTGLAIINPSNSPANLTFTLLQSDGSLAAPPVSTQLPAGAHFQAFVTDSILFGARASDFSGTLRVDSTQGVSALTLQQINNQAPRDEALLTSTPVADMSQPASRGNLVFPQFVDGGGFQTRIMLLNTNNVPISGRILFVKDDGSSPNDSDLHFDTPNGGGPEVRFQIQPQGQFSALSSGTGGFHLGFAMVIPDEGSFAPAGTAVLFFTPGDFTVATAGVAASASTNVGLLLVNSNPTLKGLAQNTGVAVANPSDTSAIDVVFTLRDGAGNVMATKAFSQLKGSLLKPRGHSSFFVNELFGTMASNFTGTMSIETSSPEGVSAVTLLLTTNERNETLFTTLPVATPSSSSGMVFFPQLVSGKGFAMQIVLLNLSGAIFSGNLNLFSGAESNNGSPLTLRLNDTVSSSFTFTLPPDGVVIFKQK